MSIFSFGQPPLYKHCKAEHRIDNGCNTLLLRTASSFRDEENALLRDEGENTDFLKISFEEETELAPEQLELLGAGGTSSAFIESLRMDSGKYFVKGMSASSEGFDRWIYCMSTSDSKEASATTNYEDHWKLEGKYIAKFGNYLREILSQSLSVDDIALRETDIPISELYGKIKLYVHWGPVVYQDRLFTASSTEDLAVERLQEWRSKVPFIKPPRFEKEKEFRFVFAPTYEGVPVAAKRSKMLQLRPIDAIL